MRQFFEPGAAVVLRYRGRVAGIGGAMPARVVEDTPARTILWWPAGTVGKRTRYVEDNGAGPRIHMDRAWQRNDVLRLMYPGLPYSVWAMWESNGRRFAYWYVNLEEPFERTPIGFDTVDHELDIVVTPEMAWRWKDEEEFAALARDGIFSAEKAAAIRAAGREAVSVIEAGGAPFNEPWPQWAPGAEWPVPRLPHGWDAEFGAPSLEQRARSA